MPAARNRSPPPRTGRSARRLKGDGRPGACAVGLRLVGASPGRRTSQTTFGAGRRRGHSVDTSLVRRRAQSRAEIESPRAWVPWYGRTPIFCCDIVARRCAPVELDPFPGAYGDGQLTVQRVAQQQPSVATWSHELPTDTAHPPRLLPPLHPHPKNSEICTQPRKLEKTDDPLNNQIRHTGAQIQVLSRPVRSTFPRSSTMVAGRGLVR